MPRPHAPVVVGEVGVDRDVVEVTCPYCHQTERPRLTFGPYRARCGAGEYRVVLRPTEGDPPRPAA